MTIKIKNEEYFFYDQTDAANISKYSSIFFFFFLLRVKGNDLLFGKKKMEWLSFVWTHLDAKELSEWKIYGMYNIFTMEIIGEYWYL